MFTVLLLPHTLSYGHLTAVEGHRMWHVCAVLDPYSTRTGLARVLSLLLYPVLALKAQLSLVRVIGHKLNHPCYYSNHDSCTRPTGTAG